MNNFALKITVCGLILAFSVPIAAQTSKFTDSRDGKTYRTVKIGDKIWMAENLNYKTNDSWCYENDDTTCNKYGRLYDWNTAMKICPTEWRLPDTADWNNLSRAIGGQRVEDEVVGYYWIIAGTKLKSKIGWDFCHEVTGEKVRCNGNGTDDYAFSALPGGFRYNSGVFSGSNMYGCWWSATGHNRVIDGGGAIEEGSTSVDYGLSVRCIRN